MNDGPSITFTCALHPDWQTTDRAERDRHFKHEHPKVERSRPRAAVDGPEPAEELAPA